MRDTVKMFRSYRDAAKALAASTPDDPQAGIENAYCFLMAILDYGLDGEEQTLSGPAAAMWMLAKPNLDASIKKAEAGAKGGSTAQANAKQISSKYQAQCKQPESKPQPEEGSRKKEVGSKEVGVSPQSPPAGAAFDLFWHAYPRKVGKDAAKKAFSRVKEPVETLLAAIERQKCGRQWQENGGQYIPNPATWLNQGRWQDEVPEAPKSNWEGGRRDLDADEAAAIRRMLEEDGHGEL